MDPYDAVMRPLKGPHSSMIPTEGYDMADTPTEVPLKMHLLPASEDIGVLKFAPPTVIECGCEFHVSSVDPQVAEAAHESHICYHHNLLPDPRPWHESLERVLRPIAIGLAVMLVILAVAKLVSFDGSGLWTN